ncbi:MAG: PD40 domain-containing protein, partial [Anaerolineae bacterium]|nr:PD40 domain-containing protein [Anaerolineae bacterium]
YPDASASVAECFKPEPTEEATPEPTEEATPEPTEEPTEEAGPVGYCNTPMDAVQFDDFGLLIANVNPRNCANSSIHGPEGWEPIVMSALGVCPDWLVYHSYRDFESRADRDLEIFRLGGVGEVVNPNLSHTQGQNLLPAARFDQAPTRSPDSQWVAFISTRASTEETGLIWEIFIAPADGDPAKPVRRLTYTQNMIVKDPMWSPTGEYIAFQGAFEGYWELFLADVRTGEIIQLTNNRVDDINPFWSPDGKKIVYQSNRTGQWQIFEMDLSDPYNVPDPVKISDGAGDDFNPVYSNDGTRIAFRSTRDGVTDIYGMPLEAIYTMNADGSNVQRVSEFNAEAGLGATANHTWSPDDTLIAYQSDLDGDRDIYVYEVATGKTRQLTNEKNPVEGDINIQEFAPTWWCDAPIVIFTSDVDGDFAQRDYTNNLYQLNALPIDGPSYDVGEDGEVVKLTDRQGPDQHPQNSPAEENASRAFDLEQANLYGED